MNSDLFDREGELIESSPGTGWLGCECDLGHQCNVPGCLMRQEFEAKYYESLYNSGELTRQGLAEGWLEHDEMTGKIVHRETLTDV